jgi:hypothetical protein
MNNEINFNTLISSIHEIDKNFVLQTKRAININLTLRNWFIGAYIYEYELNGSDRAEYGDKLLFHIEKKLENLSNCNRRQLYEYIQFYKVYPQIVATVSAQLESPIFSKINAIFEKVPTVSAQSLSYTNTLLSKLSYSMFKLLIPNLFVFKYQLELPKKEDMEKFIEEKLKEAENGGRNE